MKRWLLIAMIGCLAATVLGGCAFKDLDKRFFVIAMGVDYSGNPAKPYRVILKLGIPVAKSEPGVSNKFILIDATEASVSEAIRLLKSQVDKELEFSHARVLLFGKKLANRDIREALDWMMRRRDIQEIAYVVVAEPSAYKVLEKSPLTERLPGNSLILSFDNEGTESAYIVSETLADFYRRIREHGLSAFMPVVKPKEDMYEIDRVAIFDSKRIRLVLPKNYTRIFNELVREYPKFDFLTKSKGMVFTIAATSYRMKYKLDIRSGQPSIARLRVRVAGTIEESNQKIYDKKWNDLELMAERDAIKHNRDLLQILQRHKLDPIGFGVRYRAMGYVSKDDWRRWETDIYPNLQFKFNYRIQIYSSGTIK